MERAVEAPQEVALFEQFEELSKVYAIEPPFAPRSQVELVFDVYDGRKLVQAGLADEGEGPDLAELEASGSGGQESRRSSLEVARRVEGRGGARSAAKSRLKQNRHHFTWSKLLSLNRRSRPGPVLRCCLSKSDTSHEFAGSLSASSSGLGLQAATLALAHSPALVREPDDDQEAVELKEEAQRIIGPMLRQLRRQSLLSAAAHDQQLQSPDGGSGAPQLQQQQQVILEPGGGFAESGQISVCLFDKRGRVVRLKHEAENGRRRARVEAALEELLWHQPSKPAGAARRDHQPSEAQMERMISQRLGRFNRSPAGSPSGGSEQRLTSGQLDKLVGLVKNSLNHLIDAQLLLRNKLASEQEQLQQEQYQQQPQQPYLQH